MHEPCMSEAVVQEEAARLKDDSPYKAAMMTSPHRWRVYSFCGWLNSGDIKLKEVPIYLTMEGATTSGHTFSPVIEMNRCNDTPLKHKHDVGPRRGRMALIATLEPTARQAIFAEARFFRPRANAET